MANLTLLEAFEGRTESIAIENFLAIRSARVLLSDVTVFIGKQATGKSIVAKIAFFGRRYLGDFFREVASPEFDQKEFREERTESFSRLFGHLVGFDQSFNITYSYGNLTLVITRSKTGGKIKISTSKEVEGTGKAIASDFKSYAKEMTASGKGRRVSVFQYMQSTEERKEIWRRVPDVLFVPAARSFYSTVSEELFTFLASEKRVDDLISQFGSFFEYAKKRVTGDWYGPELTKEERLKLEDQFRPILDGVYTRIKSKDFIETSWGRVPLQVSSSGQQESLPLLLSIAEYPDPDELGQLLIIEEPEAHLFPEAQRYVLDLIINRVRESGCRVLFTTHSPYLLNCVNYHILMDKKSPNPKLGIAAYHTVGGGVEELVESDSGLIDTNALDVVSEKIAKDYMKAFDGS